MRARTREEAGSSAGFHEKPSWWMANEQWPSVWGTELTLAKHNHALHADWLSSLNHCAVVFMRQIQLLRPQDCEMSYKEANKEKKKKQLSCRACISISKMSSCILLYALSIMGVSLVSSLGDRAMECISVPFSTGWRALPQWWWNRPQTQFEGSKKSM